MKPALTFLATHTAILMEEGVQSNVDPMLHQLAFEMADVLPARGIDYRAIMKAVDLAVSELMGALDGDPTGHINSVKRAAAASGVQYPEMVATMKRMLMDGVMMRFAKWHHDEWSKRDWPIGYVGAPDGGA